MPAIAAKAGIARLTRSERLTSAWRVIAPITIASPSSLMPFSAGIALMSKDSGLSATDALQAADEALYQAKDEGRNRVALAPLKVSG